MTRFGLALLAGALLSAMPARADVVRANATTLFYSRQDWYAGQLDRSSPIFEIVTVSASEVTTPFADDVEIAVSTWGAYDLSDVRRWQNGGTASRRASGDVDTAYLKGEFLKRRLVLRVGRQMVGDGVARMIQLDGGHLRLRLPAGFGVSAYAGSPVSPRFTSRGSEDTVGNTRGEFATGGRVSWVWPGRLEVGASAALARDHGDVSRQDVGADLRATLPANVELLGSTFYSTYERQFGEVDAAASWRPRRGVELVAQYRHVRPDLFLPRTSILSVFADEERNDVGGAVRLEPMHGVTVDAEYTELFEDAGNGHRARLKGIWRPRQAIDLGAEGAVLDHKDNGGYWLARGFAAWRRSLFEVTGDLQSVWTEREVNGEKFSLTGTLTAGYRFAKGWKALVAGTAGTDPFLSSHVDVLAKLVYDQTYVTREVR